MKISMLTMYYLPDFGSAPILMNELASYLARCGHQVRVMTTLPRKRATGMSRTFFSRETKAGFSVERFWTNKGEHPLHRLLAWNIFSASAAFRLLTAQKGEILFLRTPPLQLGFSAFWAKILRQARIVVNVQDIHPDLAIEAGILKNRFGIKLAKALEKWVYRIADRIVVISQGFYRNLLAKGVPPEKMVIIPNWVDTEFISPRPKDSSLSRKLGLCDKFVVMYTGTISISSQAAMEIVLEAARLLDSQKDILFVIVGEGLKKPALATRAKELGLSNIKFLPFQPYSELPELLGASDILLVPLDQEKAALSLPSKLYNCMAASRPVIGLASPDSDVAQLISSTGCGVVVDPGDVISIVERVLWIKKESQSARKMAEQGRAYVEENFSRQLVLEKYNSLLGELIS